MREPPRRRLGRRLRPDMRLTSHPLAELLFGPLMQRGQIMHGRPAQKRPFVGIGAGDNRHMVDLPFREQPRRILEAPSHPPPACSFRPGWLLRRPTASVRPYRDSFRGPIGVNNARRFGDHFLEQAIRLPVPPADSPKMLTLFGSPPKALMLRFTHSKPHVEHCIVAQHALRRFLA
jgi:hypothetical protein